MGIYFSLSEFISDKTYIWTFVFTSISDMDAFLYLIIDPIKKIMEYPIVIYVYKEYTHDETI